MSTKDNGQKQSHRFFPQITDGCVLFLRTNYAKSTDREYLRYFEQVVTPWYLVGFPKSTDERASLIQMPDQRSMITTHSQQ